MTGKISLGQLVFSEEQIGSVKTLKYRLEAAGESMNREILDVAMEAATAYINAMKLKTAISIRKENINMTRTHLVIAKRKMAVGYSGKSDVYRLESNLSTAQTDHLSQFLHLR